MSGIQLRGGSVARGSHPSQSMSEIEIPSVIVSLNEPPTFLDGTPNTAVWKIRLEAKTTTSRKTLGVIHTLPPMQVGGDSNRIIALATVPGAISWDIQGELVKGTGNEITSEAVLDMASSPCCGTLGIIPVFAALMPWSGEALFSEVLGPNPLILSAAQRIESLTARAGAVLGTITIISPAGTVTFAVEPTEVFSANFGGRIIGPATITFTNILHWAVETIL